MVWFYHYELDRVVIHTPFHLNDIYIGITLVILNEKLKFINLTVIFAKTSRCRVYTRVNLLDFPRFKSKILVCLQNDYNMGTVSFKIS